MSLSHFDFCQGTSGYIASLDLKSCGKHFLGQSAALAQAPYVSPDDLFNFVIHKLPPSCTYLRTNSLDIIIGLCYNIFALI